MTYTHKKHAGIIRIIYLALIIIGFVLYPMELEGNKLFFTLSSLFSIVAGLYLLIKTEMVTYTYVIKEKKTDFDFFVNRAMGRRGNYVCYYYISDAIKVIKYSKEVVNELTKEYVNIGYYNFSHGIFSKDKYIILFKLKDEYNMILVEMNDEFKSYFENCMEKATPFSSEDEDEDDEKSNDTENNVNSNEEND